MHYIFIFLFLCVYICVFFIVIIITTLELMLYFCDLKEKNIWRIFSNLLKHVIVVLEIFEKKNIVKNN